MSDLHPADDYVVATTRTVDNPDNGAFAVRLWNGQQWSTAAKGPFTNRMQAAVVVTNDQIVVIGGAQGRQLDATNDTWIIDIEQ
jgi:N-acetylneuraminic acid mutarotase